MVVLGFAERESFESRPSERHTETKSKLDKYSKRKRAHVEDKEVLRTNGFPKSDDKREGGRAVGLLTPKTVDRSRRIKVYGPPL